MLVQIPNQLCALDVSTLSDCAGFQIGALDLERPGLVFGHQDNDVCVVDNLPASPDISLSDLVNVHSRLRDRVNRNPGNPVIFANLLDIPAEFCGSLDFVTRRAR